ncbi:MAG: adenylate/guanylate cyclase domain-containing protein [Candidatus Marinimicrobia bacterium]|nr:adenylate/guanylate cyclase domain-containing protein [Candidatus Neomarinimicrobiota bacterium]
MVETNDAIHQPNEPEGNSDANATTETEKTGANKIVKFLKELLPTFIIGVGSIFLVFFLHFLGVFDTLELKLYDFRLKLRGATSGTASQSALPNAEGFIDGTEPFNDLNENGTWDPAELFTDINANGKYDPGEPFEDAGNGVYDEGEPYVDLDGNGAYDEWDEFEDKGNGKFDGAEPYTDVNTNRIWDGENKIYNPGIDKMNSEGVGCWEEESCANGVYDEDEEFTDSGNGKWDGAEPFEDKNGNGVWDNAEPFRDDNGNGNWEPNEPIMDMNGNGTWDDSEVFTDMNGNGIYDAAEEFVDDNENGVWDEGEELFDIGNGFWNEGEEFIDVDECEKTEQVCHNQECVDYLECHDINQNGKWDDGLDVVIVERDDESFRLIPDPLPYSRANVWARVVRNLTNAGAKVIVFDFVFDKPDHQTKNLKSYMETNELEFPLIDGDEKFIEAVQYAEANGTRVILASKIAYEASRIPPTYYLGPYEKLVSDDRVNITTGLVNIPTDIDGFKRRYWPLSMAPGDTNLYPTLAIQTVIDYLGIPQSSPIFEGETARYGPYGNNSFLEIPSYGKKAEGFLINFFGPPSGASAPGKPTYNTFTRISLSNVLDTEDYHLGEGIWDADFGEMVYYEDQNWMDKYIDPILAPIFEAQGFINPFKGKIVLLGTSMAEDQDFTLAPFSNFDGEEYQFPGVEYHANAVQHLLNIDFIQTPLGTLQYLDTYLIDHLLIIAIFILVTLILVSKAPPLWGFVIIAVELLIWISYSIGAFLTDYLWLYKLVAGIPINVPEIGASAMIPVLFPASAIILPFGINLSYKLFTEGQDKAFLKSSFGSYISPELIDQMYDSKQAPSLGGEEGYNTAFFSDIASFSTFSEKLTAPDLVELLNEYLNAMTTILLENNGTLDKYIGDAIIAFFGAPVELEDHEYLACLTCCQMNDKLEELRQKWKGEGDRWPDVVHNMRHRIGVNCGSLVTGNMGSDMRMNYTMMGDTVNLTARLESGAKQYGIETQVGGKIYEATKDRFTYRMLDYAIVKGRSEPERTYELIAEKGKEPEVYKELLPVWEKAIELYTNQDWDAAIKEFKNCDKLEEEYIGRPTTPCKVYISRCEEYKENSPGKDWDGAYKLTSK